MMPRIGRIFQWHRRWFKFDREIILSPYNPGIPHAVWVNSGPLPPASKFRMWYSDLCVHGFDALCNSSHLLVWQWDGFIINPNLWTNSFLNWDYIGAPHGDFWRRVAAWLMQVRQGWENPFFSEMSIAGNGGFSLRSKKYLQASNSLDRTGFTALDEDLYLCVERRGEMVEKGVKFCPADIAISFSVDHERHHSSFGFHNEDHVGIVKRYLEGIYLPKETTT